MNDTSSLSIDSFSTDLTGHIALVTGASSGLGYRFAQVLAKHGAQVAIAARRVDRLDELASVIRGAGGECLPIELDVRDADGLAAAVDAIERAYGAVTILVNNAGVPDATFATRMSVELVDTVLDTNVRAPFLLSCEIARRLIAAKLPGRIVNVSSIGAFIYTGVGAALYSISKAALNRMTEALAVEWARFGINVTAMAPGAVSSEMTDMMLERMPGLEETFPRKRVGRPSDLDSTLLYLVSPSSSFVTGTVIKVDDGQQPR
ncbi:SDR family NAD(P)-dependent oxidoreductase [Desertimonas flava]|uniref:SDR family NAD(P)-dependent oxidoreductase n=1 Tax=Desertimonas flava TaxID=2064846 RepID=UPI001D0C8249|nr:SDR family NAD(P)-dependent oxidoreductase [Desertimonas flava]